MERVFPYQFEFDELILSSMGVVLFFILSRLLTWTWSETPKTGFLLTWLIMTYYASWSVNDKGAYQTGHIHMIFG